MIDWLEIEIPEGWHLCEAREAILLDPDNEEEDDMNVALEGDIFYFAKGDHTIDFSWDADMKSYVVEVRNDGDSIETFSSRDPREVEKFALKTAKKY